MVSVGFYFSIFVCIIYYLAIVMKRQYRKGLRTWIDIDLEAIRHNSSLFRGMLEDGVRLCSVVKSNAYGHCLFDFSKQMELNGVDWLAVDTLFEGLRLRREGVEKPILVLGYTLPDNFNEAAKNGISITVFGKESLKDVLAYKGRKKLRVHLKFDTGMNRQGFREGEVEHLLRALKGTGASSLKVEGMYTHFADAKDPASLDSTHKQIEIFESIRDRVMGSGFKTIVHASATAGAIIFPQAHYDMVRVGIGSYGLWPSPEIEEYAKERLPLRPVLSWKTVVADVKKASAGSGFGYGFMEKVSRDTKFAVIPIGYWHGYSRSMSSIGSVLIRGKRAKVLGFVSMDITVVDVTDIRGVKVGDEVTIIGRDGRDEISVDEVADLAGTTNYEVITRINPLIKRFY